MALVFEVKVIPCSGRQSLQTDSAGTLKCYLKSIPEQGRANSELKKFLSKLLKVPQIDVEIIGGAISRKKTLRINIDLTYDQFLEKLELPKQQKLF